MSPARAVSTCLGICPSLRTLQGPSACACKCPHWCSLALQVRADNFMTQRTINPLSMVDMAQHSAQRTWSNTQHSDHGSTLSAADKAQYFPSGPSGLPGTNKFMIQHIMSSLSTAGMAQHFRPLPSGLPGTNNQPQHGTCAPSSWQAPRLKTCPRLPCMSLPTVQAHAHMCAVHLSAHAAHELALAHSHTRAREHAH